ncbi:MAG: hypothetical protein ACT4QA_04560 [Panacagrimonas sp.]
MFRTVLIATFNLLLFRIGPQDFPYDPRLTGVLAPTAALVQYAVSMLWVPPGLAAASALAMIMGLAVATHMLLRVRHVETRFMQTYHSLLAVSSLLTLATWLPISELAPEMMKISPNAAVTGTDPNVQLPGGSLFLMFILITWNFIANANIFRHAANLTAGAGLLVALLVWGGVQMFVLFFASAALAIFGSPTPPPG